MDPEQCLEDAVRCAYDSEVSVIFAGLTPDWESEGFDRENLSLPLRTDELIQRVSAVNPNTVVVLQAGSAVLMPWIDRVAAVVYAWYGGNEGGNAIADVLFGHTNPSGRLPLTFPQREVDVPALLNRKSARKQIRYEEGIWVGYRHYAARLIRPLFPFGHGVSYTTFSYSNLKVDQAQTKSIEKWQLNVSLDVTNTGDMAGSHSINFYVSPPEETETSLVKPQYTFQACTKVYDLAPGKTQSVQVVMDKCELLCIRTTPALIIDAVSHWDVEKGKWEVENGKWSVTVGINAEEFYGKASFVIAEKGYTWIGV